MISKHIKGYLAPRFGDGMFLAHKGQDIGSIVPLLRAFQQVMTKKVIAHQARGRARGRRQWSLKAFIRVKLRICAPLLLSFKNR